MESSKTTYNPLHTNGGTVTAEDIKNLKLFLNACQVSRGDMANAFLEAGKSQKTLLHRTAKGCSI
jgi:hypothetical protein